MMKDPKRRQNDHNCVGMTQILLGRRDSEMRSVSLEGSRDTAHSKFGQVFNRELSLRKCETPSQASWCS